VQCNRHRARLLRHDQSGDQPVTAYRRSHWLRTYRPTDEEIEALLGAWFATTDDARRRDLADQIGQRAFEFVPYIPTG
jgi:hypothetical protein